MVGTRDSLTQKQQGACRHTPRSHTPQVWTPQPWRVSESLTNRTHRRKIGRANFCSVPMTVCLHWCALKKREWTGSLQMRHIVAVYATLGAAKPCFARLARLRQPGRQR